MWFLRLTFWVRPPNPQREGSHFKTAAHSGEARPPDWALHDLLTFYSHRSQSERGHSVLFCVTVLSSISSSCNDSSWIVSNTVRCSCCRWVNHLHWFISTSVSDWILGNNRWKCFSLSSLTPLKSSTIVTGWSAKRNGFYFEGPQCSDLVLLTAMYGLQPASLVLAMESTSCPLMPKSHSFMLPFLSRRMFDGFMSDRERKDAWRNLKSDIYQNMSCTWCRLTSVYYFQVFF